MHSAERVRSWAVETALPFWAERGVDRVNGGFVECVDLEGLARPQTNRRVRAQARQIYVFAHAFNVGWFDGRELATNGLDYLVDKAWHPAGDPGWAHVLDSHGSIIDPRRDLYDHAFVLLALATLFKAGGDRQCLQLIDETLQVLDEHFSENNGGFSESIAGGLPRRQNPHMHLFEAFLALHAATGESRFLDRADAIYALFAKHFLVENGTMVREYFSSDWSAWAKGSGDIWEPGHHCEWIWLLDRYAAAKKAALHLGGSALFERVVSLGIIGQTGLLRAQMGADGSQVVMPSRCWMQTEYIKALLARFEAGDEGAQAQANSAIGTLFDRHLDPAYPGGWIDHVDENGQAQSLDIPVSTLYHLLCCMTETERVLGKSTHD
jgi:mannose/cellobiose epimerase-like protein (N-acyl-D-glucosamine 2-epimerase family)